MKQDPIDVDRLTIAAVGVLGLLAILGGYLGLRQAAISDCSGAPHAA